MKQAIFLLFIFLISQNLVAQETESWKINAKGKLEVKLFPEEIIDAFILKRFGDGPWISDPIANLPPNPYHGWMGNGNLHRVKYGLYFNARINHPLNLYSNGVRERNALGINDKDWKAFEKKLHAEKFASIQNAQEILKKWAQYESPKSNTKELFPEFAVDVSNILVWNAILTHQCGVGPWTDNDSGNWSGTVPHFFPEVLNPDNCVLDKNNLRTCESCLIARVLYPQSQIDAQTIWRKPGGCRAWIWGRTSVQNRYALDPYLYFPKKAKYYYDVFANKKRAEIENQIMENMRKKYGDQIELLKAQEKLLMKLGAHLDTKNVEFQKREQELLEFAEYILKLEAVVANESARVAKENSRLENEQAKLEKEKQVLAQEKTRFYSERTAMENKCAQLENDKAQLIQEKTKEAQRVNAEKYNLESKNTQLEKEKKSLLQEKEKILSQFNNERTALQNKCSQIEKENQILTQEKSEVLVRLSKQIYMCERLTHSNKELREAREVAVAEHSEARERFYQETIKLYSEFDKIKLGYVEDAERLCQQANTFLKDYVDVQNKLYQEFDRYETLENKYNSNTKNLHAQLEQNLQIFNVEKSTLENRCDWLEEKNDELEEKCARIEREKQSLVQKEKEKNDELEEKCARIEREKQSLVQKEKELLTQFNLEQAEREEYFDSEYRSFKEAMSKRDKEHENRHRRLIEYVVNENKKEREQRIQFKEEHDQLKLEKQNLIQENIKLRSEIKILNEKLEGE